MAKTIVQELVGLVGLDIDEASFKRGAKSLDNVKKQYDRVGAAAQKLGIAAAAVAGFTVITNKLSAENERLAQSVGISSTALEAYGQIAEGAGLNTENVVDLVEELNNKLGESKGLEEITAVKEATAILGLEFENLSKLKPEEQFFRVLDAAQKLEDQQKAVSAADILLGGEANKFVGLLRTQDKGLQELVDTYIKYNLFTEESRKQSVAFNKEFQRFSQVVGGASKQLGVLLGRGLQPVLKFINEWVAENKELSQSVIRVFSVAVPAALAVAGIAVSVMTVKLGLMALAFAGVTLPIMGFIAAIIAGGLATAAIIEDWYKFITAGDEVDTVVGSIVNKIKDLWVTFAQSNIGEFIISPFEFAGIAVRSLIGWIDTLSGKLNIAEKVGGFVDDVQSFFAGGNASFAGSFNEAPIATPMGSPMTAGNTTNINNSSQVNSNVSLNAPNLDRAEFTRIVDEENARAVNANSSGFDR